MTGQGRQIKAHRAEIRAHLGFRECSVADAGLLTAWLAGHVTQAERSQGGAASPLPGGADRGDATTRSDRIVASALHQGEETLFAQTVGRLPPEVTAQLEALIVADDSGAEEDQAGEDDPPVLALIKADPGNVSLDSMLAEIGKLRTVRAVGLPAGLFADVADAAVYVRDLDTPTPRARRCHFNTP